MTTNQIYRVLQYIQAKSGLVYIYIKVRNNIHTLLYKRVVCNFKQKTEDTDRLIAHKSSDLGLMLYLGRISYTRM